MLPHKKDINPIVSEFAEEDQATNRNCVSRCCRKDRIDRIFKGVKVHNHSSMSTRIINTSKIDILLSSKSTDIHSDKERTIHSRGSPRKVMEKDQLKEFKEI